MKALGNLPIQGDCGARHGVDKLMISRRIWRCNQTVLDAEENDIGVVPQATRLHEVVLVILHGLLAQIEDVADFLQGTQRVFAAHFADDASIRIRLVPG